jgi:glycosyltransferase involved in cell wall biosynthesis
VRIGIVNIHSCSRVFKLGWELLSRGESVHLVTERFINGHPWKDFTAVHITESGYLQRGLVNPEHLSSTIKAISPLIDVFWCANEPDWIVKVVKEASQKPVIWDIHDLVSKRTGEINQWEKDALEYCDGISAVSRNYVEEMRKRTDKPVAEILSCVPEFLYPKQRASLLYSGLVYEGGLRGVNQGSEQFEYRDWSEAFGQITGLGVPVWAYNNCSGENLANYAKSQVIFLGPLHLKELVQNLTAHEVGLVGCPVPNPAFDGALPNKMFEYIAAGLPCIALNAPTAEEFLLGTGLGVGVKSVEEIPEAMNGLLQAPEGEENVRDYIWDRGRFAWTMASQMPKVYKLIEEVCK